MGRGAAVTTCFFDLDDTLYPRSSGIGLRCKELIEGFMVERLGFSAATVDVENLRLYRKHGTTMAGLRAEGHEFDFHDWHSHVHVPLPYDNIRPDPELRRVLHDMPQQKYILTNSDKGHTARCLSRLGIEDCLHGVIAFEDVMDAPPQGPYSRLESLPHSSEEAWDADSPQPAEAASGTRSGTLDIVATWQSEAGPLVCCKPQAEAFKRALALAGATPQHSMMFDDSADNIATAKRVGLQTVLVGSQNHIAAADYCVASLHNIRATVPNLWEGVEVEDVECPCGQAALVDAVSA